MRKLMLIVVIACMGIMGCKFGEMTPAEKEKVSAIKAEIEKIEKEIAGAKSLIQPGVTGLIPQLQQTRIEADKLTLSILRQHIAAIESGSKVTISAPATSPDTTLATTLEGEIKEADIELHKTKAESSLYSGGLIKATIEARAAVQELTLVNLRQQYLRAKYGLSIPAIVNNIAPKEQLGGDFIAREERSSPKETSTVNDSEVKGPEIDDKGPFDFRKIRWGMSKEDVRQREKSTAVNIGDMLTYSDTIVGKKASLFYLFDENKLWRAGYSISENYVNKNNYVDDYELIVSSLKEKYGKPKSENTFWSQDLYKNDYSQRGFAYSKGDVTSVSVWDHENTEIIIRISGENYKISVMVTYSSKELEKVYRKKEKDKKASSL